MMLMKLAIFVALIGCFEAFPIRTDWVKDDNFINNFNEDYYQDFTTVAPTVAPKLGIYGFTYIVFALIGLILLVLAVGCVKICGIYCSMKDTEEELIELVEDLVERRRQDGGGGEDGELTSVKVELPRYDVNNLGHATDQEETDAFFKFWACLCSCLCRMFCCLIEHCTRDLNMYSRVIIEGIMTGAVPPPGAQTNTQEEAAADDDDDDDDDYDDDEPRKEKRAGWMGKMTHKASGIAKSASKKKQKVKDLTKKQTERLKRQAPKMKEKWRSQKNKIKTFGSKMAHKKVKVKKPKIMKKVKAKLTK